MKAISIFKVIRRLSILFVLSILFFSVLQISLAEDTDNDGLADDIEVKFLTDQFDADSDDDGVLDGDEGLDTSKSKEHPDNDPDGDGWNNAMDADSDGDGILDGTEVGLTDDDINWTATDQTKGRFYPDQDPTTTTDPTKKDTDGDSWSDGDEDRNANGKYEPTQGEKDPNTKDYDDDGIQDDSDEDDDNDLMPDEFEKLFPNACNPLDPEDADDDYDGDGFTNIREYRGNNDKPGDKDWSDPEDPTSKPNIAPIVEFKSDDFTIDEYGNKIPRITVEAKQKITFNDTLLEVTDEAENEGLTFIWDWDDGTEPFIRYDVRPQKDPPTTHIYEVPTTYTIVLKVEDSINNVGEAKLAVDVIHPEGITELEIEVNRDKTDLKDKNTIQRGGWIAYIFKDVKNGDKITLDLTVQQNPEVSQPMGLRVFVISKKNFDAFKKNDIARNKISREYEEYWSGDVGTTVSKKKIEIEADKDDDIVVILDNRFYAEGQKYIAFDEPVEYTATFERENSPFLIILLILAIIIIIAAIIMFLAFYLKAKKSAGVTKITREAAVETQRSLDREMAELELEIQDSLRRQSVMAPMSAMPLGQQKSAPAPPGGPAPAAPGTVPKTPAAAGTAGTQPGLAPGKQPTGAQVMPGSTPGEQPMLPSVAPGQPAAAQPGQAPGSTPQPQMLPPAPKMANTPAPQPQPQAQPQPQPQASAQPQPPKKPPQQ
ncbi:hypothetical protein [[Eubacterium] cellulosolvens]